MKELLQIALPPTVYALLLKTQPTRQIRQIQPTRRQTYIMPKHNGHQAVRVVRCLGPPITSA